MRESIVYRLYGNKTFVSKELVRKVSDYSREFSLEYYVKNPLIVDRKEEGLLYKIGLCSEESLNTPYPILLYTRLILEYDNESCDVNLIDKFVDKFKEYSFILYTTFNSRPLKPKFRVVMELDNELTQESLRDSLYIAVLMEYFKIGKEYPDKSCFRPHQCQFIPIRNKNRKYRYVINKGKKLQLMEYSDVLRKASIYNEKKKEKLLRKWKNDVKELSGNDTYISENLAKINYVSKEDVYPKELKELVEMWKKTPSLTSTKMFKDKITSMSKETSFTEDENDEKSKYCFTRKYATKVALKKITIEKAKKRYKELFGEELEDNPKWSYKFIKWVENSKYRRD